MLPRQLRCCRTDAFGCAGTAVVLSKKGVEAHSDSFGAVEKSFQSGFDSSMGQIVSIFDVSGQLRSCRRRLFEAAWTARWDRSSRF